MAKEKAMFTEELLEHLSYKCGCELDVKKDIGIVNGVCPKHPSNKLLFDGIELETYKRIVKARKAKLDKEASESL